MGKDWVHPFPEELWDIRGIKKGTAMADFFQEGVRCLVIRGPSSFCAYLGVPIGHPLAGYEYDNMPIDCHGGLTFSGEGDGDWRPKDFWWYGYDYAHSGDWCAYDTVYRNEEEKKWTLKEVVDDMWGPAYEMRKLMSLAESIASKYLGWKAVTG